MNHFQVSMRGAQGQYSLSEPVDYITATRVKLFMQQKFPAAEVLLCTTTVNMRRICRELKGIIHSYDLKIPLKPDDECSGK